MLPPCAFDLCHNFHVPGWSDRKRLGRLGQLHSISFARRVRLGATILDRTCWTEEKRACWSTVGTGHSWNEMPFVGVTALSHHFAKRVVKVGLEGGESWIGQPFWLDEVIWLGRMMIMMHFAAESCFAAHGTIDGIFFDCWLLVACWSVFHHNCKKLAQRMARDICFKHWLCEQKLLPFLADSFFLA